MKVDLLPQRKSILNFNLIEVMIVIAIISILAAVAVPSLLAKKKAHEAKKKANEAAITTKVAEEIEGKHVTVRGFDEVGLVTNVEDDQLTVYFPNIGEVKFKRGMVKIVRDTK